MIYGQQNLENNIVAGQTAKLPVQKTEQEPPLLTRVIARHQGNIVNIAQTLFAPGDSREEHVNEDVDELLVVLNGELNVATASEIVTLKADEGGYIFLPHGVTQAVQNVSGDDAILLTIAIRHENFVHRNQTIEE